MSTTLVTQLATSLRSLNSDGAETITEAEAQQLWNAIVKPDEGTASEKPVEIGEKKVIEDLLEGTSLSAAARSFLQGKLFTEVPGLLRNEGTEPTPAPTSELTFGTTHPITLSADGSPLPSHVTPENATPADYEEGYYRLGLLLSGESQRSSSTLLKTVPLATKRAMLERALAKAEQTHDSFALAGLSDSDRNQLRSSAFTTIFALATSLPASGATQALRSEAHAALVQLTRAETSQRLGNHMTRLLTRDDYQRGLSQTERADCTELFEARFPQKFDVGNILDEDGYISWEHVTGHGENFFRSFTLNILKEKVGSDGFELVKEGPGYGEYALTFDPPRGEDGRVKGVRLRVRTYQSDMFDAVGERKGFSYGGHSNIGMNQENSLDKAILAGLKANKPQLAMLDLCAGLDGLDDAVENLGNLELLTTFSSSYFWKGTLKDEDGEFEGVRSSEGMKGLIQIFESLSREEDYTGMRKRVGRAISNWSHPRNPNIAFPTLTDYKEVRWMHLDGDDDGRMDANDIFYQFGLQKVALDTASDAFILRDSGELDTLNGDTVRDAALDLNVSTHYNAITGRNSRVEHTFMANGFFDGSESHELIRFTRGTNMDGKSVINLSVNSRLAHTPREALSGLTQYLAMMHIADEGYTSSMSETDRKLMGLTFAMFRFNYDAKSRWTDQQAWKQLLRAVNLPEDLPFGPLQRLIDSEHHDYAGNLKIVEAYKKDLSSETLMALESKSTGRPSNAPLVA